MLSSKDNLKNRTRLHSYTRAYNNAELYNIERARNGYKGEKRDARHEREIDASGKRRREERIPKKGDDMQPLFFNKAYQSGCITSSLVRTASCYLALCYITK